MKKLFSKGFSIPKNVPNSNSLYNSINEIEREVDIISKICEQLEQKIRTKNKLNQELDKNFNELLTKNDAIDEQLDANRKLENNLMAEIKQKIKFMDCLKTNDNQLRQMSESLEKEAKHLTEDFEKQIKELNQMKEFYENEVQLKREAYQRLKETLERTDPYFDQYLTELDRMKNKSQLLRNDIESVETQINLLKAKKTAVVSIKPLEDVIPREIAEQFADPIRVITEIAKIKLNTNQLKDIIAEQIDWIKTNGLDKQLFSDDSQQSNVKDVEHQNNRSEMEIQITNKVDSKVENVLINTNINENKVVSLIDPNANPNVCVSSSFKTSVDSSPANDQTIRSPVFKVFGNTVANNSSANQSSGLFGMFGNQTPNEESNNPSFGFGGLFTNPSVVSPNPTEDSFNLFK